MLNKSNRLNAITESPFQAVHLNEGFWLDRQKLNAETAIFYQWEQLENSGRLENFRQVTRSPKGKHQGFFYNDSDVHKWAEAAAVIYGKSENPALLTLIEEYVNLVVEAQEKDGYLFTYNQLNFPGQRWINLQIEHELYTLGHFIEAGIAAHLAFSEERLFQAVQKSANLVVDVFMEASPLETPGHQEIEIALLRLYDLTAKPEYLEMAKRFLERRGRIPLFGLQLIRQFRSQVQRSQQIVKQAEDRKKGQVLGFDISENLSHKEPPLMGIRANIQFLTGRYHQQHKPIRKMSEPVGHAVRWGYLQTAVAMLHRQTNDKTLLTTLEKSWDRMVREKMYVTGAIGSLPVVEGFGKPYELDNEFAYAETCAAIACIFWNWQMTLITGEAKYADLLEWQLYNAASVGIALNGRAYLYRNPLQSAGELTRKPWFGTACCPSNISRLWAQLGRYILHQRSNTIVVDQYISCHTDIMSAEGAVGINISSDLPWKGNVNIIVSSSQTQQIALKLRIPGWTDRWQVKIGDEVIHNGKRSSPSTQTAGGYSPFESFYLKIDRLWKGVTEIEISLGLPIRFHQSDTRVKSNRKKVALSRGPLVYCLEDIDNPQATLPGVMIDTSFDVSKSESDSVVNLKAKDTKGDVLTFIPYYSWANRKPSTMQVWVRTSD